jgi:hypothetical protein
MCYVGAGNGLTGEQLYRRLSLARYWKSASTVPDVAVRGYCLIQTRCQVDLGIAGYLFDEDVVQSDRLGGLPMWAVRE